MTEQTLRKNSGVDDILFEAFMNVKDIREGELMQKAYYTQPPNVLKAWYKPTTLWPLKCEQELGMN